MTIDKYLAYDPRVIITPEQLACCHYLERQGKRFGIDFGYQNAPALVWDELDDAIYENHGPLVCLPSPE